MLIRLPKEVAEYLIQNGEMITDGDKEFVRFPQHWLLKTDDVVVFETKLTISQQETVGINVDYGNVFFGLLQTKVVFKGGECLIAHVPMGTLYKEFVIIPIRASHDAGNGRGVSRSFNVKTFFDTFPELIPDSLDY